MVMICWEAHVTCEYDMASNLEDNNINQSMNKWLEMHSMDGSMEIELSLRALYLDRVSIISPKEISYISQLLSSNLEIGR